MVQQAIQQAIESWVERGRDRGVLREGDTLVLRYGKRFRLQHLVNLGIFAFFFGFGIVTIRLGIIANLKFEIFYLCMFGGLTAFASVYFTYAQTSRVCITDNQVSVRCFGMTISYCRKDELASAYKSPVHESVVLRDTAGKKTRVSTQFDGLRALVAWLYLCPNEALADSIRDWMLTEAPDLGEPSDAPESPSRAF
jgi:hypothetical protein